MLEQPKLLSCMLLAFAVMGAPARAETETRSTDPFHAVAVEGSWNTDIAIGPAQSIVLDGDKELLGRVVTEIVDGELRIRLDHSDGLTIGGFHPALTAHITVPTLDAFSRSGGGHADLTGLAGEKLALVSNGSGDIDANGKVQTLSVVMNGSGSADLGKVDADAVAVTMNGSGDASVHAERDIAITINGSGRVEYSGHPRFSAAIRGNGQVNQK